MKFQKLKNKQEKIKMTHPSKMRKINKHLSHLDSKMK